MPANDKLPRSISILDYRIKIRLVSKAELRKQAGMELTDKRWIAGCWGDEEQTIYIDKNLSKRQRRAVFCHELLHAIVDVSEWVREDLVLR